MPDQRETELDALVVGAGFAGLYMLHRLRQMGLRARVVDAAGGVGGTWYWNRYPGARCDVESMQYSYQFSEELAQEWVWSERYATQPEILRYLEHVADRFALRSDIQLNTRVQSAHFDEATAAWRVTTDGEDRYAARYCIMATGCLSSRNTPDFPGLEDFGGVAVHTGAWPAAGVDLAGKRVGVIGTGSSAIQAIPIIAEQADRLFVFQRTANFSVPARNRPLGDEEQRQIKADYPALRQRAAETAAGLTSGYLPNETPAALASPQVLKQEYDGRWERGGLTFLGGFLDLILSKEANDTGVAYVHDRIRELVHDPKVAELLCPDQVIGCKRLCVDTGYYETFNRDHVELVDIRQTPIETITRGGLRVGGRDFDLDALILATGFDAMTGALLGMDIRGRDGLTLAQKWSAGPRTFLGLATNGFPNLFTITGPGSPSVLTNMVPSIEQHVDFIAGCLKHMSERGHNSVEAVLRAEDEWVGHVNEVASFTLLPTCNSWYLGANIPGKPRVFMPYLGFATYVAKCRAVVEQGYEGFRMERLPT